MKYIINFLIIFVIYCFSSSSSAQSPIQVGINNTDISILTCRSGDELYSTFGHTGVRIKNDSLKTDVVFNYGLFSFNTPGFYIKFLRGQLPYKVGPFRTDEFMADYFDEKRTVLEQDLNLTDVQKNEIISFLLWNVKPENRDYPYDFFYDNCATRVEDLLSDKLKIEYTNQIDEITFRQMLKQNLQSLVWSDFGIDLVIGARADILSDRDGQMFLPEYVFDNLKNAWFIDSGDPLIGDTRVVLDFEDKNALRKKKAINQPLIIAVLLLIIGIFINLKNLKYAQLFNSIMLWIACILGFFLLFMWFGTDHGATKNNWNVLWLNPLLLLYFFVKGNFKKIMFYILVAMMSVAAINVLIQFLPQYFHSAFLPLSLLFIAILHWHYKSKIQEAIA